MTSSIPTLIYPHDLSLYPYQEDIIHKTILFFNSNETHSTYNASEPGLGKTVTSIVTANTIHAKRILIVAPAIMRRVWLREIYKWANIKLLDTQNVLLVENSSNLNTNLSHYKWIVISYALASDPKNLEILVNSTNMATGTLMCPSPFDLLILDEAHAVKNYQAKRTSACLKYLFKVSTNHLLLSGTPMTNKVIDLYAPFHAISPDTFPSFHSFANTYAYARKTPWTTEYYGLKNAPQLSKKMREDFYIRYKKEEVLKDLPPKIFTDILLPKEEYSVKHVSDTISQTIYAETLALCQSLESGKGKMLSSLFAEMRRLQGLSKVPAVVDFALQLLEQEIPIVIFTWHKDVALAIKEKLSDYSPFFITGDTSPQARQEQVDTFQKDDPTHKAKVMIATIASAGTGLTLTASCNVLLAENSFSPADNAQAIDRCHRIGTLYPVNVFTFTVADSPDEDINRILIRKTKDFYSLCDKAA